MGGGLSAAGKHRLTFLLRQDLQFMDSRGSLVCRRAGSLSMPTWGLGMATLLGPGNCESAMGLRTESIRTRRCQGPAGVWPDVVGGEGGVL